jgi:hypothetical protein
MSGEPPAKKSRTNDDDVWRSRHYLHPKLSPLWEFYKRAIKDTSTNETKFDDFVTLLNYPLLNIWLENRIKVPVPLNPDGTDDDGFLTDYNLLALITKTVLGGFDPALNTQNIMTNAKRLLLGLLQCKNVKVEFTNLYKWEIKFFKDTFERGVVFTLSIYDGSPLSSPMYLIITDHRSKQQLGKLSFIGKPTRDRANYLRKEKILPPLAEFDADVDDSDDDEVAAATEAYHKQNTMGGDIKRIESIIEGLFADENLDGVVVTHEQPTGTRLDKLRELAKLPSDTDLVCIALAYFLLYVGLPYTIQTIPIQKNIAYFASFVDRGVVMQNPVYAT